MFVEGSTPTMRAVRLHSWNSEPELVEIATPTPGAGDVLLRAVAASLCHSDLHLMEWPGSAGLATWRSSCWRG